MAEPTNHDKVLAGERIYCAECRSYQDVEDQFVDDTGDSRVTVEEYVVTVLVCGHSTSRVTRTYRSPLQQATMPPAYTAVDPFEMEGE